MKKLQITAFSAEEVMSSIISLDRLSVFGAWGPETITETDEEQQPLGQQDSDYNSAMDDDDDRSSGTSQQQSTQVLLPFDDERIDSIPLTDMFTTVANRRHSQTLV